jgi:PAS domain S-box-containing protein
VATSPAVKVLPFSKGQCSDERLFANAFEHAPNGMAILDCDGRISQANLAVRKLLGFRRSGLIGLRLSEITYWEDVETEGTQRKRVASGEISSYQLVERLIRRDGTPIWVLLSASARRSISGLPECYVLQVESARGPLLNGTNASVGALEHLLGESVHEIGNSLTPLMVNTQLIIEQSKPGEISDSARAILDAARRIAFTLRRLRTLKDLHQPAGYDGEIRMLDLGTIPPPGNAD